VRALGTSFHTWLDSAEEDQGIRRRTRAISFGESTLDMPYLCSRRILVG
jgi:hypothetical protein